MVIGQDGGSVGTGVLAFGQDLSDSFAAGWGQKREGTLILQSHSLTLSPLTFTFCLLSITQSLNFPICQMGDWRYVPSRIFVNA